MHTCGVTTRGEGLCWGYDGSQAGYSYYDYYYPAIPADGRLDVPAGKLWLAPVLAAPRLSSKVGLKVNFKTRVTTLSLYATADTAGGPNSVKWVEYYSREKRPAANAPQNPVKIRKYSTTVVLPAREVAFWVRVKDTKGKWSGWYSTKT
jgi:hypothetical protein